MVSATVEPAAVASGDVLSGVDWATTGAAATRAKSEAARKAASAV
jgi:hypothetical protein